MTSLDLNTVEGFTGATSALAATTSALSNLALLFGRPPEEWDIEEASFNDVIFHVFVSKSDWQGALSQIQDSGGRRLAKFMYPYTDGQTTDDLGRTPESFDLEILLFGDNYLKGQVALFRELQKSTPGELIHPVRGAVPCRMESYSLIHAADTRKAVKINLRLVEHNFTLASYGTIAVDKNFKSALGDLAKAFQLANAMVTKVKGLVGFINSVIATVEGLIANFQDIMAIAASNINSVFNKGSSSDIPTLLPANLGGLLQVSSTISTTATGTQTKIQTNIATVTNNVFSLATRPGDPLLAIPVENLQQSTAIALASQTIYKQVNDTRIAANELISYLSAIKPGVVTVDETTQTIEGAVDFHDEILQVKQAIVILQKAFELGLAQNGARIIEYTTPHIMSVREVAFENNISLENIADIDILNPELLSVNYIPKGTVLQVPVT